MKIKTLKRVIQEESGRIFSYIQRRCLTEGYYPIDSHVDPLPLEEIMVAWAEGDKPYDHEEQFTFSIDQIWPWREYERTRDTSSKNTPEEWDELENSIKKRGIESPILVQIGKNYAAKVGEGNHRLAIAKELGIKELPVRLSFVPFVDFSEDFRFPSPAKSASDALYIKSIEQVHT